MSVERRRLAKDMQEAMKRHEALGLNPDEEAFYDALADRPEVLLSMGDADVEEAGERADGEAAEQHDGGLPKGQPVRASPFV